MPPIIDQHTHLHLNYGHDAKTEAESKVEQALDQAASGGEGGDDNIHADTNISIC